jgi:hypothetical protein
MGSSLSKSRLFEAIAVLGSAFDTPRRPYKRGASGRSRGHRRHADALERVA